MRSLLVRFPLRTQNFLSLEACCARTHLHLHIITIYILYIYIYMRWGFPKQVLWNIKIVYIYILSISIYCILRLHIYTPVPKLTKAVLLLCMSKKWSKSLNKVTVNTFIMAIFRTFIKDNFSDQAKHAFQCLNKLFFGVFQNLQMVEKCSPLRFGEKLEFWSSEFLCNYINEF